MTSANFYAALYFLSKSFNIIWPPCTYTHLWFWSSKWTV